MDKIRFSIIMPAYNVAEYIGKAIESVQNQAFKEYELIIVDDCSTDNTTDIITKYNNIILVRNAENKAAGGARNAGIKVAKGEYIIFLDSDDWLYSNDVLEKLDNVIGNKKLDIIYMGFQIVVKEVVHSNIIPTEETCTKEYKLGTDIYMGVTSKCWNRNFLTKSNLLFEEHRYYEDLNFTFMGMAIAKEYAIADFLAFVYFYRPDSITNNIKFKHIYDTIKNIEDLYNMKDKIPIEYQSFLYSRMEEESNRLNERLKIIIENGKSYE